MAHPSGGLFLSRSEFTPGHCGIRGHWFHASKTLKGSTRGPPSIRVRRPTIPTERHEPPPHRAEGRQPLLGGACAAAGIRRDKGLAVHGASSGGWAVHSWPWGPRAPWSAQPWSGPTSPSLAPCALVSRPALPRVRRPCSFPRPIPRPAFLRRRARRRGTDPRSSAEIELEGGPARFAWS
jgi:hypothetical protein